MREVRLSVDGRARRYLIRESSAEAPVVMMLPGAGASAEWTVEETGWAELAEREGFTLVIPEALPLNPSQPSSFKKNPLRWNDGYPQVRSPVDDVAFLRQVLDHISEPDPPLFVTGFSNGTAMLFRLAEALSPRLSGLAPVAGYCWSEQPEIEKPIPTLYMIGSEDPLVPIEGGLVSTPWTREVKRPPLEETWERWERVAPLEVRVIEGLGHHWPGGRGLLSRRLFGPPSKKVIATEVIWQFFRRLHQEDLA